MICIATNRDSYGVNTAGRMSQFQPRFLFWKEDQNHGCFRNLPAGPESHRHRALHSEITHIQMNAEALFCISSGFSGVHELLFQTLSHSSPKHYLPFKIRSWNLFYPWEMELPEEHWVSSASSSNNNQKQHYWFFTGSAYPEVEVCCALC